MNEAAGSRRPEIRFEPHLEEPAAVGSVMSDPLAELARLVGQDPPFRKAVEASPKPQPARPRPSSQYPRFAAPRAEAPRTNERDDWDHREEPQGLGLRPSSHDGDHWSETANRQAADTEWQEQEYASEEHYAVNDGAPVIVGDHEARDYAAPPLTPDLWAQRDDPQEPHETGAHADESASAGRAPRRPLMVLAAVLLLTGGGLAATFLARSSNSPGAQARSAPTILAATGPNKVKLADTSAQTTPEDADAALLNKNGASDGGPAKVVNSQEQPIDLAQLPKAAASPEVPAGPDVAPAGSASPFPEPKKVKTFLVRPDGSMISASSAAASATGSIPAAAHSSIPQLATGSGNSDGDNSASAAARPATPKTGARTVTTPKAPPTSIADLASGAAPDAAPAPGRARQTASAGANGQVKPKPVETADASAPDPSIGLFALQLAAAPSEQDARSIFSRLQKKYPSELGPFKPAIRKAESGDKSVYRVRVGNLNQDQAKSLCAHLQASGGTCFVVRN